MFCLAHRKGALTAPYTNGIMLLLSLLLCWVIQSPASAVEYTVCPDAPPNQCTFVSIKNALASDSVTGAILRVKAGTYREIGVPRAIARDASSGSPTTLIPYGNGEVIIDGADAYGSEAWTDESNNIFSALRDTLLMSVPVDSSQDVACYVFVDDTRYKYVHNNFTTLGQGEWSFNSANSRVYVRMANNGSPAGSNISITNVTRAQGIRVSRCDHFVIDGVTIKRMAGAGILVDGHTTDPKDQGSVIKNCKISNCWGQGIQLQRTTGALVTNNTVHSNGGHGIQVVRSDGTSITRNTSYKNDMPLVDMNRGGKAGIRVGGGSSDTLVYDVNVDYNVCYSNEDTGIDINGANHVVVRRNQVYRNGDHGFDNNRTQYTAFINNVVFRNDHDGLSVESTSSNVNVYNNVFLHNGVDWSTQEPPTQPTSNKRVRELFVDNLTGFVSNHNILVGLAQVDSIGDSRYGRRLVEFKSGSYPNPRFVTLAGYQDTTGQDLQSYATIPTFNDTTTYDFTIPDNAAAVTDNVVDAATMSISGWVSPMWLSADPNGIEPHDAYESNVASTMDIGVFEYDPRPGPGIDFDVVDCDPTTEGQYRVKWTAVGDDSVVVSLAEPDEYVVKGSASSITESTWGGLSSFASPPAPLDPGQTQVFYVNVDALTYLRFKSKDANGHWSGLSNQLTINPADYGNCHNGWTYGGGGGGGGGCCHEDPLRGPDLSSLRRTGGGPDWIGAGENSILNGTPTGTHGADLLPIESVQDDTGAYLTHLRVSGRSGTVVDGVKLLFVDHPVGTEALACGSAVIAGRRSVATQATTENGDDVTKLVNGTGHIFNAASAATVTISTPLDAQQTPLVIECGNGGARGHAIIVESQSSSGWQEIGAVYPRKLASAVVIDAVPPGPVRLRFTGYAHVRSVARLERETENVTSTWGTLETAQSSSAGDVLSAIAVEDTVATALVGPDTLRANFSGPALGEDLVRSLFLGISATPVTASAASQAAAQRFSLPTHFALYQNAPNPFWNSTTIRLDLPVGRMVKLEIFDVSGRRVRTLVNGFMPAGHQSVVWDQRDDAGGVLGAGVYFSRLQVDTFRDRKKLVLMP